MTDFHTACNLAYAASLAASRRTVTNPGGASRWYVSFSPKLNAAQARRVKAAGFKWFDRPGGGKHIYIGYCNFTGPEPAQAEAVAKAFTDAGFPAYASDDGD